MLNRWQAHKGAACGEEASIIMCLEVAQHCSTSSTPNDSEVSAPRRLRYRSTSGYAWFAISDGTSSLRSPYALTASHHISLRRHTACTTARAVAHISRNINYTPQMAIFTQKNDTQTSEFYIKNSLQNGEFLRFLPFSS